MPQVIGYARVSTNEQNLALQVDALEQYGVDKIVSEIGSGVKPRARLDALVQNLHAADSLVIWKLDRLGRTASELLNLSRVLSDRKVTLISLREGIDISTPAGRLMLGMLALLAEMEHDVLVERTKAGIQAACRAGHYGGRPSIPAKLLHDATRLYLDSDLSVCEICSRFSISRSSLYRSLRASGITPKRYRF